MKNIKNYNAEKYAKPTYTEIEPYVYKHDDCFVTSICFEQEPELGEGSSATDISQYPLEDVLDQFCVYVSDFYNDLNTEDSDVCYLEFSGSTAESIKRLRAIIGKHVFNRDAGDAIDLVIE